MKLLNLPKTNREAIHYIILAVLITLVVFSAYFVGQRIGILTWLMSSFGIMKIIAWIGLFLFYFIFIGIALVIIDLVLHKTLKI